VNTHSYPNDNYLADMPIIGSFAYDKTNNQSRQLSHPNENPTVGKVLIFL